MTEKEAVEQIVIIKLKTNENIIAIWSTEDEDSDVERMHIIEPIKFFMTFDESYGPSLIMQYWLPEAMIESNDCMIMAEDILTIVNPSDEFQSHYLKMLTVLRKQKTNRKNTFNKMLNSGVENLYDEDDAENDGVDPEDTDEATVAETEANDHNIVKFPGKIDKSKLH